MAWEGSDRRERLPANWAALVAACKAKAGGRCEWRLPSGARCPRPGVDADHKGERDDHTKLQWLCRTHHNMKTSAENKAARFPKKPKGPRRPQRHPGDLT